MKKWAFVGKALLSLAPGLAGDILGGGVKGILASKKLSRVLGVANKAEDVLAKLNDSSDTDTVVKFLETLTINKKLDFSFLKSKKFFIGAGGAILILALIAYDPAVVEKNNTIILALIGLLGSVITGQSIIDNNKVKK